jgi:HrpA-like RNA helicase
MCTTLDTRLFVDYYDNAGLIKIDSPTFSIDDEYIENDPKNYLKAAAEKAVEVHMTQSPGDILVFLTDRDEIERAVQEVTREVRASNSALVLPLHDQSHEKEIQAVFTPTSTDKRKIIFSTNIAETSMAIDGIRYVIDSGMVKQTTWDSQRNIQVLKTSYVTKSAVQQRRSKAGRTTPGKVSFQTKINTYL